MTVTPPSAISPDLYKPTLATPTMAPGATTAKIHKTAQDFEATFLSSALNSMWEGVSTSAPFGGGQGEDTFRSFLNEAMAKSIVRRGGVGVSAAIERELIKMQSTGGRA